MSVFSEKMASGFQLGDDILASLHRQEHQLDELAERIEARRDDREFARRVVVGTANAAGITDLILSLPVGTGFRLISAACSGGAPGAGTGCAVYLGNADDESALIHVFDYGLRFSSIFAEGEYVPSGSQVVIRFIGQTPGQRCTASVKLLIENPTDSTRIH